MSYQIGDLEFNVTLPTPEGGLQTYNIFDHLGVRRAIAIYKTRKEPYITMDPALWFFGDFWGRCEYEMIVADFPDDSHPRKTDIYQMFIVPNSKLLIDMIDKVTVKSCREWLKEHK